ncbi:hypothetical protein CTI12_AA233680 [Artemisia annua]|uniref:Uncharacterized protein n=1 Tax=Artemisia annua TaxID=35608 RepID=A0A2U1NRS0_ARTAN|nr:hypothetical protein CTI12_AA233680 [Artemisia annua]
MISMPSTPYIWSFFCVMLSPPNYSSQEKFDDARLMYGAKLSPSASQKGFNFFCDRLMQLSNHKVSLECFFKGAFNSVNIFGDTMRSSDNDHIEVSLADVGGRSNDRIQARKTFAVQHRFLLLPWSFRHKEHRPD